MLQETLACYSVYHHHDVGNSTINSTEAFHSFDSKNHVLEDGFTHINRHSPCSSIRTVHRETVITPFSFFYTKTLKSKKNVNKEFKLKFFQIIEDAATTNHARI